MCDSLPRVDVAQKGGSEGRRGRKKVRDEGRRWGGVAGGSTAYICMCKAKGEGFNQKRGGLCVSENSV